MSVKKDRKKRKETNTTYRDGRVRSAVERWRGEQLREPDYTYLLLRR
jgi:hypothetical protein